MNTNCMKADSCFVSFVGTCICNKTFMSLLFSCSADGRYVKSEWMDVHAGDFVHLACDEIIPADILLLHSSDPLGICHLETSNLDGETNLKQRQIVHGLKYEGVGHDCNVIILSLFNLSFCKDLRYGKINLNLFRGKNC